MGGRFVPKLGSKSRRKPEFQGRGEERVDVSGEAIGESQDAHYVWMGTANRDSAGSKKKKKMQTCRFFWVLQPHSLGFIILLEI